MFGDVPEAFHPLFAAVVQFRDAVRVVAILAAIFFLVLKALRLALRLPVAHGTASVISVWGLWVVGVSLCVADVAIDGDGIWITFSILCLLAAVALLGGALVRGWAQS